MSLAAQIETRINKLPMGKSFGYADLGIAKEEMGHFISVQNV